MGGWSDCPLNLVSVQQVSADMPACQSQLPAQEELYVIENQVSARHQASGNVFRTYKCPASGFSLVNCVTAVCD